ncbi:hypothetical protein [Mucilaginibacter sp.]|uniref:hypothetical protein n=1 Tax=Mucilaginibacter sp. TaxID=1882438 RepID=UPI00261E6E96|nr:hypothetical protein [Mucilaginibacter sp.]MDB4922146.1 hypothetical protein [Mucilaginibacter sp.]
MKNPENDLRAFYAVHTKDELQKEIPTNEISPNSETPRAIDRADQRSAESRIAILKGLIVKHKM